MGYQGSLKQIDPRHFTNIDLRWLQYKGSNSMHHM